jgi:hypothetical protein
MSWLKAAIARVRQILSQETATPIQPAGLAHPEPTTPAGNKPTVQTTSLQPPLAPTPQPQSSELAQSTTLERRLGNEKITVSEEQPSTAGGTKSRKPAPRSRQPAKPAAKRAKKPAVKTKVAAKRIPAKAPAQTRTASRSGGRGN